jgi:hypothetical protein
MRVLISNGSGTYVGYLAATYPDRLGNLFSPAAKPRGPFKFMKYSFDNGAYAWWKNGRPFDDEAFLKLIDWGKLQTQKPEWLAVPDVIHDADRTLRQWEIWEPRLRKLVRWPLAFCAQDGMQPGDAPNTAEVIFLGGNTARTKESISKWCARYPRVHVGRVNGSKMLWECHDANVESCDGTGFPRGDQRQLAGLIDYLNQSSGKEKRPIQQSIFDLLSA